MDDRKVWQPEKTLAVYDLIRKLVRAATKDAKPCLRTRLRASRTIAAIETLARSDRRLAATTEQWDRDPFALNTPGGIVDLRTGAIRPGVAEDYASKITAAAPGGECPKWLAFLDDIFDTNLDIIGYIQKVLGYCLTGSIREHALFFGYGTGGNGKSVLLAAVNGIFGDYAKTAPIETFIASGSDKHPTDLAGLAGARLVSCSEVEEGRKWAEAKVKTLTGGEVISARFMRQDFFEFTPEFKLFIVGNHRPGLRGVDAAIRRRMHLVPFSVSIAEAEQDKRLTEKLRGEWPGILAWMIEGAIRWNREGLQRAAAVQEATDQYFESEDAFSTWLDERCQLGANFTEPRASLFASWKAWADRGGEHAGSQRQFFFKLETRGFQPFKTGDGTRSFRGLRLKPSEADAQHDLYCQAQATAGYGRCYR